MGNIGKVVRSLQTRGVKNTVSLVAHKFSKADNIASETRAGELAAQQERNDILSADFTCHPYHTPPKTVAKKLDIAFVAPPFGIGAGGHVTLTRFMRYLQHQGHKITVYPYNNARDQQTADQLKTILEKYFNFSTNTRDVDQFSGRHQVVVATSWQSAYGVFNFPTKAHKMYFVQDFEPYFYGVGSNYKLAEATYKMGFYGITAGKWLTEKVGEYGMSADYFDFGVDLDIYKPDKFSKKPQICFYARASTERRGFELGVMALEIFAARHPEYEIILFGQDTQPDLPFKYTNKGVLAHKDLAKLYQESTACLLLSLTNVSLLPLELLAAGCVPVMNDGENNTMVLGPQKGILYTNAYPIDLADKLCEAVENRDITKNARAISQSVKNQSWETAYQKVEQIILREVTK